MQPQHDSLVNFGYLVLLTIARLRNEAYGTAIWEELCKRTGLDVPISSVFINLKRLKNRGYVSSFERHRVPGPVGRPRMFYQIEPAGLAAIQNTERLVRALSRNGKEKAK